MANRNRYERILSSCRSLLSCLILLILISVPIGLSVYDFLQPSTNAIMDEKLDEAMGKLEALTARINELELENKRLINSLETLTAAFHSYNIDKVAPSTCKPEEILIRQDDTAERLSELANRLAKGQTTLEIGLTIGACGGIPCIVLFIACILDDIHKKYKKYTEGNIRETRNEKKNEAANAPQRGPDRIRTRIAGTYHQAL